MTIIDTSAVKRTVNPSPWLHQMREENPVCFDPDIVYYFGTKGGWQVFRYEDVKSGISNYELFSSEYIPKQKGGLGDSLAMTDPPRHKQLRSLISKAFAPAVVAQMEVWIRAKCEKMLFAMQQSGKMDFIKDFAELLPPGVIAQLLGIPEEYHRNIASWTQTLIGDPNVIGLEAYQQVQQEMTGLLMEHMEDRKRAPQEDLMTYLLQSEIDGEQLSQDDLIANSLAVLTAGTEAPIGLLGNAMLTFAERPELQQHLAQHTEDIPKAINEVLRFRYPVLSVPRIARQELVLNGQLIRKGDLVNFWLASANVDPAVFPSPDTFDIYRDNHAKILSFGHGIHGCIGALLTKLEAKVVFETVFKHTQNIAVAPENVLKRLPNVSTFKFESLLIEFN